MRRLALLAAALALASHSLAADDPRPAARAFYAWVLAHPWRAVPSAKEQRELGPLLTGELGQLLKAASETEARCIKAAPKGEKPLIIEGDLFVGNLEGASEVAYGEVRRKADSATIESDLMYIDKRFPKAHPHRTVAWRDQLELRLEGGRWKVHDVHFPHDKSLASELRAYVDEGRRSCARN